MAVTIKIEGMEEALKNFRALEGAFADEKVEHMLLRKGAEPLRDAISAGAPRRTGKLAQAIVARIGRRREGFPSAHAAVDLKLLSQTRATAAIATSAGESHGFGLSGYPYLIEYGVKPHVKRPIKGAWMYRFGYQKVRQIASAGFAARRYFRDAVTRMRGPIKVNVTAGFQELLRDALPYGESHESAGFGD